MIDRRQSMALAGKRVLVTRPREKALAFASLLEAQGARPVLLPTIEISPVRDPEPLDRALKHLQDYDWVIFTSTNAVDAVWERPAIKGAGTLPASVRVAAIGPKTARSLQSRGIEPHFVPDTYISEAILTGLGELDGRRLLLPMADIAHDTLPEAIQEAGGCAEVVTAYHTVPAQPDHEGLQGLQQGLEAVTFTSGSTARNFVTLAERAGLDPRRLPGSPIFACIGPKTARAAADRGLWPVIVPKDYTVEGLIQVLRVYFSTQEQVVR